MIRKIIAILRIRGGSYNQWQQKNPILKERQLGLITSGQDKDKIKVGDGVTHWNDLNYVIGAQGDLGPTPNLTIGTVENGGSADATITGTPENPVLNLTLPQGPQGQSGPKGDLGPAPNLSIGTVEDGGTADANITGTPENPILNLTLPQGPVGPQGPVAPWTNEPEPSGSAANGSTYIRKGYLLNHQVNNLLTIFGPNLLYNYSSKLGWQLDKNNSDILTQFNLIKIRTITDAAAIGNGLGIEICKIQGGNLSSIGSQTCLCIMIRGNTIILCDFINSISSIPARNNGDILIFIKGEN